MPAPTYIRASMLDGWNDCRRRAAVKQWRKRFVAAGYTDIREPKPSVGAAMGTAVHAAAKGYLLIKRDGVSAALSAEPHVAAVTAFVEEAAGGMTWDATTPSQHSAELAIASMIGEWRSAVEPHVQPKVIEPGMIAAKLDADGDFILTGHPDVIDTSNVIEDLKTGKNYWPPHRQLGSYAINEIAHGHPVEGLRVRHITRPSKTGKQKPCETYEYDLASALDFTRDTLHEIMARVKEFTARQDAAVFPANGMSMMCHPSYCPAFATSACAMHTEE